MDGGPFRVPQPADRGTTNRQERTQRQQEEPEPVPEEPVKTVPHRVATPRRARKEEDKAPKRSKKPIIALILIVILLVAAWFAWSFMRNADTGIDKNKYQVVSLSDGQVYFGKLSFLNDNYMKLTDVYYLQPLASESTDTEDLQNTDANQNNFKLVRFTDIIYGPENEMIISKDQIVHYDNLTSDSKVSKGIKQYKDGN